MNVILVDDHPLIRIGLFSVLTNEESLNIVGEASNRKEALAILQSKKPDIAIVDLYLGGECTLDMIAEAKSLGLVCKFIVLSSSPDEENIKLAKRIGVSGFLLRESVLEELVHALRMIRNGRNYYDQRIVEVILKSPSSYITRREFETLTPKETEVLIELGKGLSNKEISEVLSVTEYTVKKHVSRVLAKLNLGDRTQAALYANAKGLVRYTVN
ncbi:LuxR C-terminal-related transcriptional regulator [Sporosarcina koreensis]|uniref:LuxR C-terminal-related transcriptional regulator n=1 Tax=Sporosarcina koreensis TaxID=334735 RepID=A0ABW0U0F3_9BACL